MGRAAARHAFKASLLEPLRALQAAMSCCALVPGVVCAARHAPNDSVAPYFALNASAASFTYSALQAAVAGSSGVAGGARCEVRHAPDASVAPYFALNASAPSFTYSALQAAVAGSSAVVAGAFAA